MVRAAGTDQCIVTTDERVVLGRVRGRALDAGPNSSVEDVMEPGPTTIRTNETLESVTERLRARNVDSILVTTSDGKLVGTLYRSDAEQRLEEGRMEEAARPIDDESCCCCKD